MIIDGKEYQKSKTNRHMYGRFVDPEPKSKTKGVVRNIVSNHKEEPLGLPTMNFGQEEQKQDDDGPLGLPKWD